MKSIYELTGHINTYMSQQVFSIYLQPKQDIPIPGKDDNISENFGPHEDEESTLKEQDIEEDYRNLVDKSLDIGSCTKDSLSGRISQAGQFGSGLLPFLREVRFSHQEFAVGILVPNIKYNHSGFQNNNPFYPFHD